MASGIRCLLLLASKGVIADDCSTCEAIAAAALADPERGADMVTVQKNREQDMAKEKKAAKAKGDKPKLELIAGGEQSNNKAKNKNKNNKAGKKAKEDSRGLHALGKVLDHPLVGDLIAVGALAAVAAIAESNKEDSAKVKSTQAVKTAGKAAAAAIGARLLKVVTTGGEKKA
jgi:hypothetical protein